MPVPSGTFNQQGELSCLEKMKRGFALGFCMGMATGFMFGGFTAVRFGIRGRELITHVGKTMLHNGGTFGTFLAIGTGIRC